MKTWYQWYAHPIQHHRNSRVARNPGRKPEQECEDVESMMRSPNRLRHLHVSRRCILLLFCGFLLFRHPSAVGRKTSCRTNLATRMSISQTIRNAGHNCRVCVPTYRPLPPKFLSSRRCRPSAQHRVAADLPITWIVTNHNADLRHVAIPSQVTRNLQLEIVSHNLDRLEETSPHAARDNGKVPCGYLEIYLMKSTCGIAVSTDRRTHSPRFLHPPAPSRSSRCNVTSTASDVVNLRICNVHLPQQSKDGRNQERLDAQRTLRYHSPGREPCSTKSPDVLDQSARALSSDAIQQEV